MAANKYYYYATKTSKASSLMLAPGQKAPIDLRAVVSDLDTLTNPDTWHPEYLKNGVITKDMDVVNYYIGMLVYVVSEQNVYVLTSEDVTKTYSQQSQLGWKIAGSDVVADDIVKKIIIRIPKGDGTYEEYKTGDLHDFGFVGAQTAPLFNGDKINPIYLSQGKTLAVIYDEKEGGLTNMQSFKEVGTDIVIGEIPVDSGTIYIVGNDFIYGTEEYEKGTQFIWTGERYVKVLVGGTGGDANLTWKVLYPVVMYRHDTEPIVASERDSDATISGKLDFNNYWDEKLTGLELKINNVLIETLDLEIGITNKQISIEIPKSSSYNITLTKNNIQYASTYII